MDNEMKNSMRELSMDEMDKVSGGAGGMCDRNGKYHPFEEIISMGRSMTKSFGYDIAFDTMTTLFNISKNEYCNRGDYSDLDKMDILLAQMQLISEHLDNSGSTY